jgi:hypothetical protein
MNEQGRTLAAALALAGSFCARADAHQPTTDVTFDRDVIRVLRLRCLPCHGDGGAAVRLTSYADARPWARAIRDEVLARRMPPWPAQPGVGEFENDGSLPPALAAILVAWADGGAPEGDARDLPRDAPPPPPPYDPIVGLPVREVSTYLAASAETLVALRPQGSRGANVEVDLLRRDGSRVPLLWIRAFDPARPYTYRLRAPIALAVGDRLLALSGHVALTFAPSKR